MKIQKKIIIIIIMFINKNGANVLVSKWLNGLNNRQQCLLFYEKLNKTQINIFFYILLLCNKNILYSDRNMTKLIKKYNLKRKKRIKNNNFIDNDYLPL